MGVSGRVTFKEGERYLPIVEFRQVFPGNRRTVGRFVPVENGTCKKDWRCLSINESRITWPGGNRPTDGTQGVSCLCVACIVSVCISLPVCLSVCLPVCLSFCLSACLSLCLSLCLSACLSLCLSVCLSLCLSAILPLCLSVCPSAIFVVETDNPSGRTWASKV